MAISFDITTPSGISFNTTTQSTINFSLATSCNHTTYIHTQYTAASVWEVTHNLNRFPSVTIVDSGENVVVGDVQYTSSNQLKCYFSGIFSGKAYLN